MRQIRQVFELFEEGRNRLVFFKVQILGVIAHYNARDNRHRDYSRNRDSYRDYPAERAYRVKIAEAYRS